MKKSTRKSFIEGCNSVGNFSTRFSLPSFVRRVNHLTDNQINAIRRVGFGNVLQIPNQMLRKNLLVELMERWSCDKNAFIFLPGVITINLMDVALILGLRVTGDPVILKEDAPFLNLEKEYGASLWNRKISISSIEERLDSLDGIYDEDFTRSFLLFVFGTLLFPNTTGKVDSRYLSFLRDLDKVSNFAWGAAVLADIVNWLCKRKETRVQYVGGCLIFLQIWCYEHINIARPSLVDCSFTFPRVCRWANIGRGSITSLDRRWFNTKFKELEKNEIFWKLQLASEELEIDIIKELLEAQGDKPEIYLPQYSSTHVSIDNDDNARIRSAMLQQCVVDMESDSEMDIVGEVHGAEKDSSNQLRPSQIAPMMLTNNIDFPSTSQHVSEEHIEQTDHQWIPQGTSRIVIISDDDDDDLNTRSRILEEHNINLKKEVENLRKENGLLKNQILSNSKLEEQNVKLRKEVEELRIENQRVHLSADSLVDRLERLVCDESVNAKEEQC